jgi:hypothetical protein
LPQAQQDSSLTNGDARQWTAWQAALARAPLAAPPDERRARLAKAVLAAVAQ